MIFFMIVKRRYFKDKDQLLQDSKRTKDENEHQQKSGMDFHCHKSWIFRASHSYFEQTHVKEKL